MLVGLSANERRNLEIFLSGSGTVGETEPTMRGFGMLP